MFPRLWVETFALEPCEFSLPDRDSKETLPQYICLDSGGFFCQPRRALSLDHSSQSDFPAPLHVGSVPGFGASSAFANLPKDTILMPVSSFIVPVSIPEAQ